jgi:acetyl esterase/lipase
MLGRRAVLGAGAFAPGLVQAQALPPKPHTIEELLRPAIVRDAAISPDGKQLAVLEQRKVGDKTVARVLLNQLANLEDKPLSIGVGDYQVDKVEWAKPDRLLIWITLWKDAKGRPYGFAIAGIVLPIPVRRVISVGLDGKNPVILFSDDPKVLRRNFNAAGVVDFMHHDPAQVLMQTWDPRRGAYGLYQVDVYTGHATQTEKGAAATDAWITQHGLPVLRLDSNRRGTVFSIFGRAPGETEWKLIRKSRRDEWRKLPDFDVVGPSSEPGVVLVNLRVEGEDTKAVRSFDLRTMTFGAVVGQRPPRDMESAVVDENLNLVATASRIDRLDYQFPDAALGGHYRAVVKALKDDCNVALFDLSLDHKRMVLKVTGPQEPGAFHIYDREAKRLSLVATLQPWLEPERLARMETLKVKTRDGAEITAYLSVPPGAGKEPLPLVVMPHGGPEVRDVFDYNLFVQVLATRGWLVLQPNFRGSGGYGKAFGELGHGRWGDRMQEDVEDALAQVLATGRADPHRLAICGASFGGYSALMGAIRRPELYRCAVSLSGVSDLVEMLKHERDEGEDSPSYRYWVRQIGDPKTDAEKLRRTSPRFRAAEIGVPVLLLHGGSDQTVPALQSKLMADALSAAGKPVEHVVTPGEGHDGWSSENYRAMFEKVSAFIAKSFA